MIENNTITLTSGASFATGGSQSVGMLLGWSYANGFTARNNHLSSSGYGVGIMVFGSGTAAKPMILEGNVLTAISSVRTDTADGTGVYIANQFLHAADNKRESTVILRNHNTISGYVKGIDVVDCANSSFPLFVTLNNNSLAGT